ncbi:MAG: hypothetical protein Q9214_005853 [Letrouitia sp. 1 TL-2023]
MSTLNMEFVPQDVGYDSSLYSPMSSALSPLLSSFESSPEMTNLSLFSNAHGLPSLTSPTLSSDLTDSHSSFDAEAYPSPPKEGSHRRTQSVVTIDLDGVNEDTGITEEQISGYIMGPLAENNKYMCTYENCKKLFGRKENIRSHVQTHLGDRQWRCNHCHKRFVRQHDLKRHAKIHTGEKSHRCLCGQPFLRRDALTRHRQRNMCAGGFGVVEGNPQSPSKRGRPKKRPEMEDRMQKAARTRQRILEKSSTSSVSGSSDYSFPSPESCFRELTTSSEHLEEMVSIEPFRNMDGLSPEFMEEFYEELQKHSSPLSDLDSGSLFETDSNPFDISTKSACTPLWMD